MTDIHTHIVPNVDDGARNMEESLALLELLAAQGVCSLIATPHFYADKCLDLGAHIERMEKAFRELKSNLKEGMPQIYLGHEVLYFNGISSCEDMKKLTINNSNYILLELPYSDFSSSVINEIVDINLNLGLIPILAHVERYAAQRGFREVMETVREGYALAHVNCDQLLDKKSRKICLKLIKEGLISFIATDTHSIEFRPPRMEEARILLEKKIGRGFIEEMNKKAQMLIAAGE